MARGIYVVNWNAITRTPILLSGASRWIMAGDPVDNQALVMVEGNDLSVFDDNAIKVVQSNAFDVANKFGVVGQDLTALFVGIEVNPTAYEIPEGETFTPYTPNLPGVVGTLEAALENPVNGVVELAAGTYTCENATIANGMIVRPAAGAHVVINLTGHLLVQGDLVDVDILNAGISSRQDTQSGIHLWSGGRLIGCTISNILQSGVNWWAGGPSQIIECLIYNYGYCDEGWAGHGHGIYTHNNPGGMKQCLRTLVMPGFRRTFQLFSGSINNIQDYLFQDCVFSGYGGVVGGSTGVKRNITFNANMQHGGYFLAGQGSLNCEDITITDCIFGDVDISIDTFETVIESGNTTYDASGNGRGYTVITDPHVVKIVPCTLSQRKTAHIGILFPKDAEPTSVDLDLSSLELVNGDYELVNAYNPDEAHPFMYSGAAVTLPLTNWTQQRPVGWIGVWPEWKPEFSAWILRAV